MVVFNLGDFPKVRYYPVKSKIVDAFIAHLARFFAYFAVKIFTARNAKPCK